MQKTPKSPDGKQEKIKARKQAAFREPFGYRASTTNPLTLMN